MANLSIIDGTLLLPKSKPCYSNIPASKTPPLLAYPWKTATPRPLAPLSSDATLNDRFSHQRKCIHLLRNTSQVTKLSMEASYSLMKFREQRAVKFFGGSWQIWILIVRNCLRCLGRAFVTCLLLACWRRKYPWQRQFNLVCAKSAYNEEVYDLALAPNMNVYTHPWRFHKFIVAMHHSGTIPISSKK